ncbi:alpha/beta fold hydrolase [Pelagibius litoralis]|uniref:Alpha/beta fold hydrolase n=2 Tax=Pelagibius litoralis TaxID=374515 RepID=A0A967C2Q2_9PROT|nr:alpha/beta fold hydrolase [Pelagibius litoralis]
MRDGSGDRLVAKLHEPAEPRRGLVVLVHGLTGCEDSFYIRVSTQYWLSSGYAVLRLNLRGAGPSRPLCRLHYHAGRSADLRDALESLRALAPQLLNRGIFLVGYSLGANLLIRFLAEEASAFPVVAGACVSAPIDLKAAQRRIMDSRNWIYHRYLLARMREEALAAPVPLSEDERNAIYSAASVYDFDDQVVAPANGFTGADDYYARCSGLRFLSKIVCPTLAVHAENDPWIPAESYRHFDWTANPALSLAMPRAGGHVGFHAQGSDFTWHDQEIGRFFALAAAQ